MSKGRAELLAQVEQAQDMAEDQAGEIGVRAARTKEDAIGFAIAAIQEAQYAVLDAALARSDADALAGTS